MTWEIALRLKIDWQTPPRVSGVSLVNVRPSRVSAATVFCFGVKLAISTPLSPIAEPVRTEFV